MKTRLFVTLSLLIPIMLQAQAPFTTLAKEPTYIKSKGEKFVMYDIVSNRDKEIAKLGDGFNDSAFNAKISEEEVQESEDKNEVGFFKDSSLALNILSESESRASLNAQVIFYKINILTPVNPAKHNWRYNLPVMVISKLSTSYDSISGASAIDVLDYEAAPVTLRIMPSFKISKNEKYKENLLFGFYADARGINVQNTETNDYSLEVVGSAGIGFTLTGHGEAGIYNKQGDYEAGEWLISTMLQGAVGDKAVIQKLFNTEKDYVTSFQSYFSFNIAEGSKFNLKIGYQHFFKETMGGTKNNFSIALGI